MNDSQAGGVQGVTTIMLQKAMKGNLSVQEAAILLKEYANYRTLGEKLSRAAGSEHLQERLVEGLMQNDPDRDRDSVRRKVSGWLTNKHHNTFIKTETAIELCFILRLPLEEADALMASITDEGFHWRDPEQIPLLYCLCNGQYDYRAAIRLRDAILRDLPSAVNSGEELLTEQARQAVTTLGTEAELRDFMIRMNGKLGKLRQQAYRQFKTYMDLLEAPETTLYTAEEAEMTVRDILRVYLHQGMLPEKAGRKGSLPAIAPAQQEILQSIVSNWPNETTLSKMASRQIDVTRKVLILLFLATDGNDESDEYDEYDAESEWSRDDLFEDRLRRMNTMLVSCGYRQIDARNPFDWMILYVISVDDIFETDSQMDEILKALFSTAQAQETV